MIVEPKRVSTPICFGYGTWYARFCNGCGVLLCDKIGNLYSSGWNLMPAYLNSPGWAQRKGLCVGCAKYKAKKKEE